MQQGIDLSGLKDIHLPPVPSLWPPPFSGVLLIVFLTALCFSLYYAVKFIRRMTARKYALKNLNALEASGKSSYEKASALLLLLKRLAVMKYKEENVASLYGEKWLDFLISHSKTPLFSGAVSDIIKSVQYAPPYQLKNADLRALFNDARTWINLNI